MRRYDHVEQLGRGEVEGIDCGLVHVFPKLDGTNGAVWCTAADGLPTIHCASRNRELTLEKDNHGFMTWVCSKDPKAQHLRRWLLDRPDVIVYGEWLVPHTLKTYRPEAWRRFWIFDVFADGKYVSWSEYSQLLPELDLIQPLCTIQDPSEAQLRAQVAANTYLVQDGCGVGEGIVIKNYGWMNRHGRQPWAKLVRNEFKEQNARAFGTAEKSGEFQVEIAVADQFCTPELVGKTRAKIVAEIANEQGVDLCQPNAIQEVERSARHRLVPRLLGTVFHDMVVENAWQMLKVHRNPVIDFGKLNKIVVSRIKEFAKDLF